MTNLDTILKSRDIILPIKVRLGSCLENPRVGGAWWAAIYAVAQSQTRLKRLSSSSSSQAHGFSSTHVWL